MKEVRNMALPQSLAQPKAPPDREIYGVGELELFRQWTRNSFLEATGEQAPEWNPAMRIKRWYDSAAAGKPPEEPYVYRSWALVEGRPVFKTYVITNAEAATLNLPGAVAYGKRQVESTSASMVAPDGTPAGQVSANILCTLEEARALASEIERDTQLKPAVQRAEDPWPFLILWGGEARRIYNLLFEGGPSYNAGLLLGRRHAEGVGAPGSWSYSAEGGLVWHPKVSRDTVEQDVRPPYPCPMRDLEPGEEVVAGFAGLLQVRRKPPATPVVLPGGMELREWLKPVVLADRDYWRRLLD
jgi:hypothetical protein